MTPLLLIITVLAAPMSGAPKCRVEQRVIAWSEDGAAALLYQHQTCVPHLPPISLWVLRPGDGGVGERVEIWRPHALDDVQRLRGDALVVDGRMSKTPLNRSTVLPGVLVPHPDPDARDQGHMGSPFLTEAAVFATYDGEPEAAAKRCEGSFPCAGLCLYAGHFSPGRRWLVCAAAGVNGAEVPLRYVKILPGGDEGGAPALNLEKELGRWNGRVLKQRNALRAEGVEPPIPEVAGILDRQNEALHRLAAQALAKRTEREAVDALLDLLDRGSLSDTVPGLLSESPSPHLEAALAARLERVALAESELASALLGVAAERCAPVVWSAARRFVTVRGVPVDARVRLLDACRPHVPNVDADFVMALATSDDAPLALRVAAGRILGGMRGETPGRLKGKLWRYEPPKEVMDAIRGR